MWRSAAHTPPRIQLQESGSRRTSLQPLTPPVGMRRLRTLIESRAVAVLAGPTGRWIHSKRLQTGMSLEHRPAESPRMTPISPPGRRSATSTAIGASFAAAALVLLGYVSRPAALGARIEPLAVDPASSPWYFLATLDGSGSRLAQRICEMRRRPGRMTCPDDLLLVPGVGTRLLHQWQKDLTTPWRNWTRKDG